MTNRQEQTITIGFEVAKALAVDLNHGIEDITRTPEEDRNEQANNTIERFNAILTLLDETLQDSTNVGDNEITIKVEDAALYELIFRLTDMINRNRSTV